MRLLPVPVPTTFVFSSGYSAAAAGLTACHLKVSQGESPGYFETGTSTLWPRTASSVAQQILKTS